MATEATDSTDENDPELLDFEDALVEALALGLSRAQTAETLGVSTRTVARRVAERPIAQRIERRRSEYIEEVVSALGAVATDAVTVLRETILDGSSSGRLRAAEAVLRLLLPFRRQLSVDQRLDRLEAGTGVSDG